MNKLVENIKNKGNEIVDASKLGKINFSKAYNELCGLSIEVYAYLDTGKLTRNEFHYLDNILCHHRITVREVKDRRLTPDYSEYRDYEHGDLTYSGSKMPDCW